MGEIREEDRPRAEVRSGRAPAGQDVAKREQILAGADRVISRKGFDAASMNDITREAQVSKGTLYVYFSSKEELFEALMDRTRNSLFQEIDSSLEGQGTLAEKLRRFGMTVARILCSDVVVRAHRTVLGVSERMPEMGRHFHERGGQRAQGLLIGFLRAHVAEGDLVIPDVPLAAAQFAELCTASLFRRRLFAVIPKPPDEADLQRVVDAAVAMFLGHYRAKACESTAPART